jgi:hypothetical protein
MPSLALAEADAPGRSSARASALEKAEENGGDYNDWE